MKNLSTIFVLLCCVGLIMGAAHHGPPGAALFGPPGAAPLTHDAGVRVAHSQLASAESKEGQAGPGGSMKCPNGAEKCDMSDGMATTPPGMMTTTPRK